MKTAQNTALADVSVDLETLPAHESDAICRTVLGSVSRLFDDPAVLADYKRWKKERQREKEQNHDT
jgi:hypothetical protein